MTTRPAVVALFLLITLAGACATAPPQEARPGGGGPSAVSPQDRTLVDTLGEAIGRQGGQLFAAQSAAAPDCARICQLVGNICALAEKICAVANRYPSGDPVASDCVDGRGRCQHARETAAGCACRQ